jgi:hypothetical protein
MSTTQSWRLFAGTLSTSATPVLPVGPGRWHVLFGGRKRPLLVPAGDLPVQQRCLRHFIAKPFHRRVAELMLRLNALSPRALLPELRYARARGKRPELLQAPCAAIQIGTPGPMQKASALLMTGPGRPYAIAKIAMGHRADAAVEAEAGWLRAIGDVPEVLGQVPRLLGEGTTDGGRRYLVTSVAPSTNTTNRFTPAHARFLANLRHVHMRVSDFELSGRARELHELFAQLSPHLDEAPKGELQRALADCEEPLLYWSGPYVASQGDFAPWNIRTLEDRVFVFDWESGCQGASPLDDVLHFELINRAVHGQPVGPRQLRKAMACAGDFVTTAYADWEWTPRVVSGLTLAYLLGLVLRYSAPDRRISFDHPVIARYWDLIQRRREWMTR